MYQSDDNTKEFDVLETINLAKHFKRKSLWSDITFTFHEGQLTAVTGPSGCGKTTLLNCLGTLEQPDQGQILFKETDIVQWRAGQRRKFRAQHLGYISQDYALIDNESVIRNVAIALNGNRKGNKKSLIGTALRRVGLEGYEKYPVNSLSGGEQQRVAIARLYVRNPSVILADEPTGSLDADNAALVLQSLRDFAAEGATVVISTHDPSVTGACDNQLML